MIKKIATILPGTLLPQVKLNLPEEVLFFEASLEKAAKIAMNLEKQGVEVIISRGGTAQAIREATNIPVVGAEATSFDVLETLWDIKKQYPNINRIGLINYGNTSYDTAKMSEILNLSVEQYSFVNSDSLINTIKKAQENKTQIIIGGTLTIKYAREMGIIGILQQIGHETIIQAFNKAQEIISTRMQDQAKTERLRAILNFIHEGVISVDTDGIVTIFNHAAEKILNVKANNVIGKPLVKSFPELKWDEVMKQKKYSLDQLITINNTQIVANHIPINVDQKTIGIVSTFRQVNNILKTEQKIRKELLARGLVAKFNFDDVIGNSFAIQKTIKIASLYAQTDSTILITGESGTGKEIFAQSIHQNSNRREGPFVAINCAALPEPLLESELFGYEEGAFTGAKRGGKQGLFELAHNGTIFLDEIGDMSINLQTRLLRVIQEKAVMRVGGEKVIPINVRIIAATNRNLSKAVEQGKFREDLYYRINVLNLKLPSLRERSEDIPILLRYFVDKYCKLYNKERIEVPEQIINKLVYYHWPGNVRELVNFAERFVILSGNVFKSDKLFDDILLDKSPYSNTTALVSEKDDEEMTVSIKVDKLSQMENDIIRNVYELTGKNKHETAKLLGISRTTVWKKLK